MVLSENAVSYFCDSFIKVEEKRKIFVKNNTENYFLKTIEE